MTDPTDVTLPITTAQIGSAVDAIVEKALPSPLGELCMPVGLMKRELTAYAGELVLAADADAAGIHRDARNRLARHLYLSERLDEWAPREWDPPQHVNQEPYLRRADTILAVITGKDT